MRHERIPSQVTTASYEQVFFCVSVAQAEIKHPNIKWNLAESRAAKFSKMRDWFKKVGRSNEVQSLSEKESEVTEIRSNIKNDGIAAEIRTNSNHFIPSW